MDAQHFSFYIILSNYVRSIFFYQDKDHNVWYIRFHVCIMMHRCKRRVCKRKKNDKIGTIVLRVIYEKRTSKVSRYFGYQTSVNILIANARVKLEKEWNERPRKAWISESSNVDRGFSAHYLCIISSVSAGSGFHYDISSAYTRRRRTSSWRSRTVIRQQQFVFK